MIVVCEGCQKRFQLDDARIPAQGARVRCKHCHHRFRVPPPGDASTEAREASAPAPAEPEVAAESTSAPAGDDTLFGPGETTASAAVTGGAPIDGDRTLFGSMEENDGDGPTRELRFVNEAGDATGAGAPSADALDGPSSDALDASSSDALDASSSDALDASSSDALDASSSDALDASGSGPDASSEGPADADVSSGNASSECPAGASASAASDAGAVAAAPEASTPDPGETSGGDDSWEFVGTTFEEEAADDDEPAAAPEPAAALDAGASGDGDAPAMPPDLADGHEAADPGEATDDSLRAVGPGAGPDAATFEMAGASDADAPLQLEDESASHAAPGPAAAAEPVPASEPVPEPESAPAPEVAAEAPTPDDEAVAAEAASEGLDDEDDDWGDPFPGDPSAAAAAGSQAQPDLESEAELGHEGEADLGLERDAEPGHAADGSIDRDPDWPMPSDDCPQLPPPGAWPGNAWIQHAGWALSLLLLLAVAQGTVRIAATDGEAMAGRVELDGLVAENVRGRFVENARSGTLFVVSGELHNPAGAPRPVGALRVVLLDAHGLPFEGDGATVGRALGEAMVRETPVGVLRQRLRTEDGALAGRRLAPGETVPFQAILGEVPEAAERFRLEPTSSRPGRAPAASRRSPQAMRTLEPEPPGAPERTGARVETG